MENKDKKLWERIHYNIVSTEAIFDLPESVTQEIEKVKEMVMENIKFQNKKCFDIIEKNNYRVSLNGYLPDCKSYYGKIRFVLQVNDNEGNNINFYSLIKN